MDRLKFILVVVVLVLAFGLLKSCNSIKEQKGLIESLSSTLDTTRNSLGQQKASILVIYTDREKSFLKIKTQDSLILWLQKTVKDYKGRLSSAIVIRNTTTSNGSTVTTVIRDTVDNIVYDTYSTRWKNKWDEGYILASKDSIHREMKFRNEYEVTIGNESNGWFKKRTFKVSVLNLNPNTYTTELRAYSVSAKPKRFTLGIQAGYGINLLTMKPALYLGAGMNFTVIGIK